MFRAETQESVSFEELTTLQHGLEFTVSQLGPCKAPSSVSFYQTTHVGYNKFRYGTAYEQTIYSRPGILSFGLLDADNPPTWVYNQLIPKDALTVFPRHEALKAASPVGFRGNAIHISADFMASLAEQVHHLPLNLLLPAAGIYAPDHIKLSALRAELLKWQQLVSCGADSRTGIIARREESLSLSVIAALADARHLEGDGLIKSERGVSRALEIIHGSELENISAMELCGHTGCSQRSLEKGFLKRFGVTPKKYIKCLRMAQVHQGLRSFSAQRYDSIIDLAGSHGFWHMGQFAADYRRIYGELPSATRKAS
jgi:AraC family ethanolamine operon transcriptional activator